MSASGWRGIPASPNWFFSGAAAYQRHSGLFAYGAANKLVLLTIAEEVGDGTIASRGNAGTVPSVVGTLSGHNAKDRVSGVAFSPHPGTAHVCATCGTDGVVQVWDLDAKLSLKQHLRHDRKSVAAVVCSAVATRPTVVYSGDVKGLVVGWDYLSGSASTSAPYKESVISLASAQASTDGSSAVLVAVGYKGGGIAVLDFSSGTTAAVLHRLKGHAQDVQCLSWRPTYEAEADEVGGEQPQPHAPPQPHEVPQPQPHLQKLEQQPMVLCSSGKDRTIKMWTITADVAVETRSWPLPPGRNKRSGGRDSRERVWLTHAWAGVDTLISTSHGGDLLRWDLDSNIDDSDGSGARGDRAVNAAAAVVPAVTARAGGAGGGSAAAAPEWTAFPHLGHAHAVFSCVVIPPLSSPSRSRTAAAATGGDDEEGYQVITISSNRQIVQWDCNEGAAKWTLPTIGGHIYALAASAVDPGAVAIGCGDNLIRVWQTGVTSSFECQTLWKGVQSRVHALSWHPILEGILAFGLEDGSVGVYDVNKGRHTIAHTAHLRAVTTVCWLPLTGENEVCHDEDDGGNSAAGSGVGSSLCALYSCGDDGCIYEHGDPRKAGADAVSQARNVTACIRANLTDDGRASAFEPTTISWYYHDDSKGRSISRGGGGDADGGGSTSSSATAIQTLLAVGCVDGAIIVCNAQLEVMVMLRGQRKEIRSLDWTFVELPAAAGDGVAVAKKAGAASGMLLLASGSDDSTVRVISVATVLASEVARDALVPCDVAFRHYKLPARVTSVAWSPHGDSLLVAGSYDGTAQVWDVAKDAQLANFRGHTAKVLAVLWSPLQPHLVLSGSVDQQVCLWDWEEQHFTFPPQPQKRTTKSKKVPGNSSGNSNHEVPVPIGGPDARGAGSSAGKREEGGGDRQAGGGLSSSTLSSARTAGSVGKRGQQRDGHRADKRPKSLLPNCSIKQHKVEATQLACCELAARMYTDSAGRSASGNASGSAGGSADNARSARDQSTAERTEAGGPHAATAASTVATAESLGSLGLFGSRNDAVQTIAAASSLHTADKRFEASFMMELWQGTGVDMLEQAMHDCTLTDAMVAMSPMAGQAVWSKVAVAYAKQLSKSGDHHVAAGYYLATHNVHQAIDAYCAAGMFEEAVAVAKVRLSRHDPKLLALYKAWAKKCEGAGHFEQAAKCYLMAQNATAAVQVLSQRGGKRGLLTAYSVATSAGIASTGLAVRAVQECRKDFDFVAARTIAQSHSDLKATEHLLAVEQKLISAPRSGDAENQKDVGAWGNLYFSPVEGVVDVCSSACLVAAIADAWQGMEVMSSPNEATAMAAAAANADGLLYSDSNMQDRIVVAIRNGVRALVYACDAAAAAASWLDAMTLARDTNDLLLSMVLVQQLLVDGGITVEWMLRCRDDDIANRNLRTALCAHVAFGVILQAYFSSNLDVNAVDPSFRSKTTKFGAQLRSTAAAAAAAAAAGGAIAEDKGTANHVSFDQLVIAKDALIRSCPSLPPVEGDGLLVGTDGNSRGAAATVQESWEISRGPEPCVAAYYLRLALRAYVVSDDITIAQSAKAEMECVLQWALACQEVSTVHQDAFAAQL